MGLMRNLLIKTGLFPWAEKVYLWLVQVRRWCTVNISLPFLVMVPFLRRIWYGLFSSVFAHEMEMYAKARLVYYRRMQGPQGNPSLLRRNIHRIEKGLLMRDRKPVFAVDYIHETVAEFLKIKQNNPVSSILDWADDVLVAYFNAVETHTVVDKARTLFHNNRFKPEGCTLAYIPFKSNAWEEHQAQLIHQSFSDLVYHRKSVRIFERDAIPSRDLVDKAVVLAAQAPSSCNRQPFEFRFFDNAPLVDKLAKLPGGTKGFSAGIPMLCVVIGKMDVSPSPGDRHLMYIDGSLASMTLMLALESLGVATCPVNWPDNADIEHRIRKIIELQPFERPIMMIAMGYAAKDGLVAFSKRKSLDELRKYN